MCSTMTISMLMMVTMMLMITITIVIVIMIMIMTMTAMVLSSWCCQFINCVSWEVSHINTTVRTKSIVHREEC
ncbi:hypothetical protein DVH24_033855 [Malus domestica]|uniref:Uncharacterized protein n=1 Tax=Malus domestica TaxID=3750 RepID=A0A498KPQ9_MALDO|nr:hypothetical protein DVH24_033855 [Malus domestica]